MTECVMIFTETAGWVPGLPKIQEVEFFEKQGHDCRRSGKTD
jgi:hypothetical protein